MTDWSAHVREWFGAGHMQTPRFHGLQVQKSPVDLWRYVEVIEATRPDLIIETGTAQGGSAWFFAEMMRLFGTFGRVITIDASGPYSPMFRPPHTQIIYVEGDSGSAETFAQVEPAARGLRTMVVLDSDHSAAHVTRELNLWAPLVTPGCYLVVEDTAVNGHPLYPDYGPGPWEALEAWLPQHPEFERNTDIETRHGPTIYPGGWLVRRE